MLHQGSDGHNLTMVIFLLRISHGPRSKMKGRSNGHIQFNLCLYSLSSMKNVFLDYFDLSNLLDNTILKSLGFLLFYTHFGVKRVLEIKIPPKKIEFTA